ncbi:MAG: tRNA uridine-5-carboxymethylaminomethyl(34) synthesis GTPase MnmE [Thermodesulfobacteriota bacterium]|nr:tRNA uridine-5-carboxymethylaminomethyl(34) synthesis GTPase MnmE [Thermodesulfobacteriota bacterium]
MDNATIAAIATPTTAAGGIGIIRISGPDALDVAGCVFSLPGEGDASLPLSPMKSRIHSLSPYRLYRGYITEGSRIVDEVMLVIMPGPRSYTGEDVAEIQAHGGRFGLKTILSLVLENGTRLAEPGEFTRRAFLNGRMDLTQAEAVADIVQAGSDAALAAAVGQAAGTLRTEVGGARSRLINGLANVDAAIDFSDQAAGDHDAESLIHLIQTTVMPVVERLISRHDSAWHVKDGVKVAIAGAPNVGKSTLLNGLANAERAIVSEVPGTTRDLIQCTVVVHGIPLVFTDTAGIREKTEDRIEEIGRERALNTIETADVVLFLVDAGTGVTPADEAVFRQIAHDRVICVANKIDLAQAERFVFPRHWTETFSSVRISAKTRQGLNTLKKTLLSLVPSGDDATTTGDSAEPIPNLRHKDALVRARTALVSAETAAENGVPLDIVAIDIREAVNALGEITGERVGEEVLDRIFQQFCVGK